MKLSVAAATALLLLAACSSEPELREPDPTASPSTTPTAAAPTMPAQAKEDTPSGAATYVAHWVRTFNFAARTGDAGGLRAMSRRCDQCLSYARDFETLDAAERPDSDVWKIEEASVSSSRDPLEVTLTVGVAGEPGATTLVFELTPRAPFEVLRVTVASA